MSPVHGPRNNVHHAQLGSSRAITMAGLEHEGRPDWGPAPVGAERDPRDGYTYALRQDGNLEVRAPDGRTGVFTPDASWVEGELRAPST